MKHSLIILFLLPLMAGAQTKHPTDSLAKYKLFWEKARDRAKVTTGGEKARWETIESTYWQSAGWWSHELADSSYKAKKKK